MTSEEALSARIDVIERVLAITISRFQGQFPEQIETKVRDLAERHLIDPGAEESRRWPAQDRAALRFAELLSKEIGAVRAEMRARRPLTGRPDD